MRGTSDKQFIPLWPFFEIEIMGGELEIMTQILKYFSVVTNAVNELHRRV